MHHKAIKARMREGTTVEITFQDGKVMDYDMAGLFSKHPQLKKLENRDLFESGRLLGFYGVVWNDELDIDTETIYEEGRLVRQLPPFPGIAAGEAVLGARADRDITQKELSERTGIDQGDISRIERGIANPTIGTLEKIAEAMCGKLRIIIELE